MKCSSPFVRGMHSHRCGQCMPCRINKRREWTHRILLEAAQWEDNAFITLTYSDENLRVTRDGLPTLVPLDAQLWLKRIRKAIKRPGLRFFLVGEYGDETQRPHLHVVFFGFKSCYYGTSRYRRGYRNCCPACDLVRDTWKLGHVELGTLEPKSAQYVARYTTKKLTSKDDPRLHGRHPEFQRSSKQKGGIGYSALHEIASQLLKFNLVDAQADVPSALRHGRRLMPLGRYLRRKLRLMVGHDEKAPQVTLDQVVEEVRALYENTRSAPTSEARALAFKNALIDEATAQNASKLARLNIYKGRRSL